MEDEEGFLDEEDGLEGLGRDFDLESLDDDFGGGMMHKKKADVVDSNNNSKVLPVGACGSGHNATAMRTPLRLVRLFAMQFSLTGVQILKFFHIYHTVALLQPPLRTHLLLYR